MSPFPFPKQLTVKEALLCTFAYFDLFDRPLTRNEVTKFFLFEDPDDSKIDIYLKESPMICEGEGYFSLNEAHFKSHAEKLERSKVYWKKVARWRFIFQVCPFVDSVMVCNSLPIEDLDESSDIDLFIVAQKNRLFLARFCITLLTSIFGLRRHGSKTRKRFCLSFYISEDAMDFSSLVQEPYDIYLAHWVKTLEPISGDYSSYENFMQENERWLAPYFASFTRNKRYFRETGVIARKLKSFFEFFIDRDSLERKVQNFQLKRIYEKMKLLSDKSGTVVNEKMLKFHDHDARAEIRQEWVKRLNSLL